MIPGHMAFTVIPHGQFLGKALGNAYNSHLAGRIMRRIDETIPGLPIQSSVISSTVAMVMIPAF